MKRLLSLVFAVGTGILTAADPGSVAYKKMVKEIRHELVMLPYYNVFDNLSYKLEGSKVTLLGQVAKPTLKADAGRV